MKRQLFASLMVGLLASPAIASFTPIQHQDLSDCDTLGPLPTIMDELGTGAFPANELISATFTFTSIDACPLNSDALIPNVLLIITNLTNISFTDLHYVQDPQTTFSNFDGIINGQHAVKLDNVGINRPLIAELGGSQPLVFEPGETWEIVLDDWLTGTGLTPADMGSIGVPSTLVPDPSSGSIVAIPVPEPASLSLLALGALAIGRGRI